MFYNEESNKKVVNPLSSGSILRIICEMLKQINKQILFHNERTAFIALNLARHIGLGKDYSLQNIVILSLLHTIGFFRNDTFFSYTDAEEKIDYFSKNHITESKYVFSCYYLEFMTPLKHDALALENFLQPYDKDMEQYVHQEKIKSILYFSARISDFIYKNPDSDLPQNLNNIAPNQFNPEIVHSFQQINRNNTIVSQIKEKQHLEYLDNYINKITLTDKEKNNYLKLIAYLLDFKSTSTMTHSINTSCYALALGMRFNLSQADISELFVSAMLHDIGKICTPQKILEAPGRLSPEEMGIMRYHVNHSKKILTDLVPTNILDDVYRHHEKLNGTGYPNHLTQENLTFIQRIITVSDITSALNDSRSYKDEYDADKTLSIIKEMTQNNELDSRVVDVLINHYDDIQKDIKMFQKTLKADFSKIFSNYNDFVFSNLDTLVEKIKPEEIEEIEELETLEEL